VSIPKALTRNEFKANLIEERREWTNEGIAPRCPWCRKGITNDGPDLHEVIISRGEAQGNKPLQKIIMQSRWNCVLVHHSVHITEGDTYDNDTKGILQLLEIEGFTSIIRGLLSVKPIIKGRWIDAKIRRVQIIHAGQVGDYDFQLGYFDGDGPGIDSEFFRGS